MEEKKIDAAPAKKKRIDADSEAQRLLELELSLKNESKISNWLCTILTMGFIFVFAILLFVLPDKEFSAEENRVLATFPEFSRESFFSGEFGEEFGDYISDIVPTIAVSTNPVSAVRSDSAIAGHATIRKLR